MGYKRVFKECLNPICSEQMFEGQLVCPACGSKVPFGRKEYEDAKLRMATELFFKNDGYAEVSA